MLTEQSTIDNITVTETGILEIRRADKILRDGVEISKSYHRHCLAPGSDLTNEDQRVVDVANAVWTPEVIAAYEAKQVALIPSSNE